MMSAESQNRLREIDVLNFEHTSLAVIEKPKNQKRRKKRNNWRDNVIVAQWIIICILSALVYIAQAGPIW